MTLATCLAVLVMQAHMASATDFPHDCPHNDHASSTYCFNPNNGTQMTGIWTTYHNNRTVADAADFIIQDMWGYNSGHETTGTFMEGGLFNGLAHENPCNCVAYEVFWADHDLAGGEYDHFVTNQTPNGTSHSYEMLQSGCACQFNFYYDYNYQGSASHLTGGVFFNQQVGIETQTLNHELEADNFNISSQYRDTSGVWHNWPSQWQHLDSPCGVFPAGFCLNGSSSGLTQWSDSKPA